MRKANILVNIDDLFCQELKRARTVYFNYKKHVRVKSTRKCNRITKFIYKNCTFIFFSLKNVQICSTRAARYIFSCIYLFLSISAAKCKKHIYFIEQSLHFVTLSVLDDVIYVLMYKFILISARRLRASGVRGMRANFIIYFIKLLILLLSTRRSETSAGVTNHQTTTSGGETEEGAEDINASSTRQGELFRV